MADNLDPETRRRTMAAVKSGDTKPELILRKVLHAKGFRYRLRKATLPGKPDIVLPKYHAVIFVHGCFWHGHDCGAGSVPQTRRDYWTKKIQGNRDRDATTTRKLLRAGWRVAVVWECSLTGSARLLLDVLAAKSAGWLKGRSNRLDVRGRKMPRLRQLVHRMKAQSNRTENKATSL